MNDGWISGASYQDKVLLAPSGVASDTIVYIQQTLLLTLEDISGSLENDTHLKVFPLPFHNICLLLGAVSHCSDLK